MPTSFPSGTLGIIHNALVNTACSERLRSGALFALSTAVLAQATWTSATGVRQTGDVLALAGSPKGTAVTIWTDAQGNLTSPPLQLSQVAGQADVAALGAIVAIVALYLCATGVVRYVMYRRRMAAWDADWAVTAQAWNRQRW